MSNSPHIIGKEEEYYEMSIETARELGLVPRAKHFVPIPKEDLNGVERFVAWVAGIEPNRKVTEEEYRSENKHIINQYCSDKDLLLCKVPRYLLP